MDFEYDPSEAIGFDPMFDPAVDPGFDPTGFGPAFDPAGGFGPGFDPTGFGPADDTGFAFDPQFGIPGLPSVEQLNQFVDAGLADTTAQLDQLVQQSNDFSVQLQQGVDTLNADGRFDDYLNQMDRQDAQMVNGYQQDVNSMWAQTNAESSAAADDRAEQFRENL